MIFEASNQHSGLIPLQKIPPTPLRRLAPNITRVYLRNTIDFKLTDSVFEFAKHDIDTPSGYMNVGKIARMEAEYRQYNA